MSSPQVLLEKIQALPVKRIAEVEDFVDFLSAKCRRLAAMDRLLAMAPLLEAANAPPITEDQIQAEVDAARTASPALTTLTSASFLLSQKESSCPILRRLEGWH